MGSTVKVKIDLSGLNSKIKKDIELLGAKEVHRRRKAMARIARRNESPDLAQAYDDEAKKIAKLCGLEEDQNP